jgi:hypothetical protein
MTLEYEQLLEDMEKERQTRLTPHAYSTETIVAAESPSSSPNIKMEMLV